MAHDQYKVNELVYSKFGKEKFTGIIIDDQREKPFLVLVAWLGNGHRYWDSFIDVHCDNLSLENRPEM